MRTILVKRMSHRVFCSDNRGKTDKIQGEEEGTGKAFHKSSFRPRGGPESLFKDMRKYRSQSLGAWRRLTQGPFLKKTKSNEICGGKVRSFFKGGRGRGKLEARSLVGSDHRKTRRPISPINWRVGSTSAAVGRRCPGGIGLNIGTRRGSGASTGEKKRRPTLEREEVSCTHATGGDSGGKRNVRGGEDSDPIKVQKALGDGAGDSSKGGPSETTVRKLRGSQQHGRRIPSQFSLERYGCATAKTPSTTSSGW